MIYFISDTHFAHKKILEFERGDRFKTIQEHDNFIMSLIEAKCKKDDILYHLGDFGFGLSYRGKEWVGDDTHIIERWQNLPCKKVIILGNHDKYNEIESLNIFDEIYRYPHFLNDRILLSHEPEMVSPYVLNIHGHLHNSYLDSKNHLNVCIHMTNYSIYSEKRINKLLGELDTKTNNFLFEWYKDLYVFTKNENDKILTEEGKVDIQSTFELWKNTFINKELIDDTNVQVRRLAHKGNEYLYYDKDGNNYIGHWNSLAKKEEIVRCKITETSLPNISNKWELCWYNGKDISKIFPKIKSSERYKNYYVERLD